ncbi:EmrB/QacA subfamily drug resistance transporter [Paraburkholderia sp. BL27I4N3]|uniref:MFS transporter n=1 Tax=Paraburkholderia sp. BL27I4N3 TaxID=1938805 RepID=UPI000E26BBE3|nr:MFS transporter [Paraburkholderia sp. BL27I4N3]REE07427.1 EmrB/QacA subfamily drug resistance transporter [Paraburkholderia sp. BL27I4N3]
MSGDSTARFSPIVPLIIGGAMLVQTLNSTVIINALPTMARSMNHSPVDLNFAVTAYLLATAVFLPLSAWMADRFGSRTVFRAAIFCYVASSVACGLSASFGQLLVARICEGASGAMMTPVGRTVLLHSVPRKDLVRATSYLTMPSLLGPVLGPLIGGFIVTYFSWRWIFFMNLPIGLFAIFMTGIHIPQLRESTVRRLDIIGTLLCGLGLAAIILGLQNIARGPFPVTVAISLSLGGAVFLWLYGLRARRTEHPVLDLSLLRLRSFRAGVVGGQFLRMLNGSAPFLLSMLFQVGFGLSALSSGMMTCSTALAALLMKTATGPILRWLGFRTVLTVNAMAVACTFSSYALFKPTTPHVVIISLLFVGGFFRSLQFTALNSIAYVDVKKSLMSSGSTLVAISQPLGQTLGVAIAATIIQILGGTGQHHVPPASITPAFVILGIGSLMSLAFFLPLPRDTGQDVTGHVRHRASGERN